MPYICINAADASRRIDPSQLFHGLSFVARDVPRFDVLRSSLPAGTTVRSRGLAVLPAIEPIGVMATSGPGVSVLPKTFDEERATDSKLTVLAESKVFAPRVNLVGQP